MQSLNPRRQSLNASLKPSLNTTLKKPILDTNGLSDPIAYSLNLRKLYAHVPEAAVEQSDIFKHSLRTPASFKLVPRKVADLIDLCPRPKHLQ
jgi:hypothetical protein